MCQFKLKYVIYAYIELQVLCVHCAFVNAYIYIYMNIPTTFNARTDIDVRIDLVFGRK